uniref:Uncharacterized protein n=1 Tax=Arundo donax TaxID=35708 RepID=A0A0A9DJ20_ARUDO
MGIPSSLACCRAGKYVSHSPTTGLPERSMPMTPWSFISMAKLTVSNAAEVVSRRSILRRSLTYIFFFFVSPSNSIIQVNVSFVLKLESNRTTSTASTAFRPLITAFM